MGQEKAMFSQYMFNGLAINPAYSSVDEALTFTASARQQWTGFKGAPNTQNFSVHTPIGESNTSVGALLIRDQIGEVITETGGMATMAQRIPVGEESYFSVGLNFGVSQYSGNYSQSQSPTAATDPIFADQHNLRINAGIGLMLYSNKYYLGIASPFFYHRDINAAIKYDPKTAYKSHYALQAGYIQELGPDLKIKPNFLVKYVNGAPLEIDLNANLLIKETIWLGASYRSFDSFDFLGSVQVTPNVQIGYSYDQATTALRNYQTGTHEVVLIVRFPVRGRDFPRCYF